MVCDSHQRLQLRSLGQRSLACATGSTRRSSTRKGRVLVTTFASNAARLATLGDVARDTGRQLCVAGRSLDRILKVAQAAGYLRDFPPILSFDQAASVDPSRAADRRHRRAGRAARRARPHGRRAHHPIKLDAAIWSIFSSKQIPGNEIGIGNVMNELAAKGVEIITDRQAHVHVCGHPGRPELGSHVRLDQAADRDPRPRRAPPHRRARPPRAANGACPRRSCRPTATSSASAPGRPEVIGHEKVGRLVLDGDVILPADGATMQAAPADQRERLSRPPRW